MNSKKAKRIRREVEQQMGPGDTIEKYDTKPGPGNIILNRGSKRSIYKKIKRLSK